MLGSIPELTKKLKEPIAATERHGYVTTSSAVEETNGISISFSTKKLCRKRDETIPRTSITIF
jgi:hypothetical protein